MKVVIGILVLFSTLVQGQEIAQVSYDEMLAAMETQENYNVLATTNVARFQSSVLLNIARRTQQKNPENKILFLHFRDWYNACKAYTGYTDREMPEYSRLAVEFQQNQLLDLRQEKICKKINNGRKPKFAMNVVVGWEKELNLPAYYSFVDTLSEPVLKARNARLISYRILDFGDMVAYDDMTGLSGQPASGILGLIFKLIGEGQVMWSRYTITDDGLQVNRARAKKGIFEIESTLTVYPDGTAIKNLPANRSDLQIYEKLLSQPLDIDYYPIEKNIIEAVCGK
jgi:hypothetical protein